MANEALAAGRAFLDREARLVERRIAEVLFDGAAFSGVVDAVRAYRNPDGGFGHGLEPDKRCPASLPIDVECALDALWEGGGHGASDQADGLIVDACDWLASVASPEGAVPLAFPVIERYPRAEHWSDWTYEPGLNPTAGLAGRMHRAGIEHPWLRHATDWVWSQLESGSSGDAHTIAEVLNFLAYVPDRSRADIVATQAGKWLADAQWFEADPEGEGYGLTPLHLAAAPDSPWRRLFSNATIDGFLDRLARDQQPDGGWLIAWEPPGAAAMLEWRGIETLRALRTLRSYGRL